MKLVLGSSFLKRIVQNAKRGQAGRQAEKKRVAPNISSNIFLGGETLSVDPSQRAAAIFRVCKAIFFSFYFHG